MSLSPDTEFKVEEYSFEGKQDGSEKSFFNLVKGGLRAITGAIGHTNKKNYRLNTPVATIGIRGTEFLATMRGRLLVRVGDGAVFLQNRKGDLVLYKGQSGQASDNEPPKRSDEQPVVTGPSPEIPFDFIAGNDTNSSGEPCLIAGGCAFTSETTIEDVTVSQAWVEDDDGVDYYASTFPVDGSSTNSITIDGQGLKKASNIRTYSTDTSVNTIEANADVLRDSFGSNGGLSWSRWVGGTYRETETYNGEVTYDEAHQNYASHYIWGTPTSSSDMQALSDGYFTAEYSVVGYTTPTLTNTSTGITTSVSGAVTGNMSVDFGAGNISLNLNVGSFGNVSANGYGAFSGGSHNFSFSDSDTQVTGFFSGAKAAQAGVMYQKDTGSQILSGAAALNQTSLTLNPD